MKKTTLIAASSIALLTAGFLGGCASSETTTETCTVNDKAAASKGGDSGGLRYLVYTDECGVLTVDDAPLKGQWNSSDTYGSIVIGTTYEFELYGFRNGLLSSYPNIITVTPLEG